MVAALRRIDAQLSKVHLTYFGSECYDHQEFLLEAGNFGSVLPARGIAGVMENLENNPQTNVIFINIASAKDAARYILEIKAVKPDILFIVEECMMRWLQTEIEGQDNDAIAAKEIIQREALVTAYDVDHTEQELARFIAVNFERFSAKKGLA